MINKRNSFYKGLIESFFAICILFLVSCEINIGSELYTSDIENMLKDNNKSESFANCSVELEVSSKSDYEKNPDKYLNIIKEGFFEANNPELISRNVSTLVKANGKLTLTKVEGGSNTSLIYFYAK